MKANDVMIGDWVTILRFRKNGSDRNVRINGIGRDCILAPGMFQKETGCDPYDYKQLAPIPLTPDILEKNGFRYERDYGAFMRSILGDYAKDDEPVICIGWNSAGEVCYYDMANTKHRALYGRDEMKYVHQLQNALRLCGLEDLADTFQL